MHVSVSNSIAFRRRTKLNNANKNTSIFALPYATIKTLRTTANSGISDTSYTVRKTFVGIYLQQEILQLLQTQVKLLFHNLKQIIQFQ